MFRESISNVFEDCVVYESQIALLEVMFEKLLVNSFQMICRVEIFFVIRS